MSTHAPGTPGHDAWLIRNIVSFAFCFTSRVCLNFALFPSAGVSNPRGVSSWEGATWDCGTKSDQRVKPCCSKELMQGEEVRGKAMGFSLPPTPSFGWDPSQPVCAGGLGLCHSLSRSVTDTQPTQSPAFSPQPQTHTNPPANVDTPPSSVVCSFIILHQHFGDTRLERKKGINPAPSFLHLQGRCGAWRRTSPDPPK